MHKWSYRVRPFCFDKRQMNNIFVKQLCLFVPPPPVFWNTFSEIHWEKSRYFHLDSWEAATLGSDGERGAPVFDPDVTSVMDETRPANGKTQLFQLPTIWHPVSAVLYVRVRASLRSLRRQKREDTGEKVGHVLPPSQHVSLHWLQFPSSTFLSQIKLYTSSELNGECLVVVATHFQNGIIVAAWMALLFSCNRRGQAVSVLRGEGLIWMSYCERSPAPNAVTICSP